MHQDDPDLERRRIFAGLSFLGGVIAIVIVWIGFH
jgi:hypothetical protein